jgi:hypothetical protein
LLLVVVAVVDLTLQVELEQVVELEDGEHLREQHLVVIQQVQHL